MINVQWSQAATEDLLRNADGLYLVDFELADELLAEADRASDFLALLHAPGRWWTRTGCANGVWDSCPSPYSMTSTPRGFSSFD